MLQAAQSLLPIALMIGLGAMLLRSGFFSDGFRQDLDRFVYWVALPCLLLEKLPEAELSGGVGWLAGVLLLATVAGAIVSVGVAWLMRLPGEAYGVFVQAGFRGNLVFVGLPIVVFAVGGDGRAGDAESAAVLVLAPLVPLYNVLAVAALLMAQHQMSWASVPRLLKALLTNPLVIATAIGGLLTVLGLRLPVSLDRTLEAIGQTAAALALVSLGAALVALEVRGRIRRATVASLMKVVAMPTITFGLCWALGLPDQQTLVAMIFAACPTAAASYVLATQLEGDPALAASCIVVSTVLSFGALAVVLALFG